MSSYITLNKVLVVKVLKFVSYSYFAISVLDIMHIQYISGDLIITMYNGSSVKIDCTQEEAVEAINLFCNNKPF